MARPSRYWTWLVLASLASGCYNTATPCDGRCGVAASEEVAPEGWRTAVPALKYLTRKKARAIATISTSDFDARKIRVRRETGDTTGKVVAEVDFAPNLGTATMFRLNEDTGSSGAGYWQLKVGDSWGVAEEWLPIITWDGRSAQAKILLYRNEVRFLVH